MTRGPHRTPKMHRTPEHLGLVRQSPRRLLRTPRSRTIPLVACTGAVASLLSPVSSLAVSLGELRVQSALGQPLQAMVPVQLASGEFLGGSCLSAPSSGDRDLRSVPMAQVQSPEISTPGLYDVRITTAAPLYEPMYALSLQVKCPGTALIVRQYVLMLDLPGSAAMSAVTPPAVAIAPEKPATAAMPAEVPAEQVAPSAAAPIEAGAPTPAAPRRAHRTLKASGAAISPGSSYRVRAGDTLSTIAARVHGHAGTGLWRLADQILAVNPGAFIGGNRDLIKLGSEISIPVGAARAIAGSSPVPEPAMAVPAPVAPEIPRPAVTGTPAGSTTSKTAGIAAAAAPVEAIPETALAPSVDVPRRVFADVPATTPKRRAAVEEPKAVAARDNGHPFLAAGMGVLLGAGLSLLLLRRRLIHSIGALLGRRPATELVELPVTEAAQVPRPVPVKTRTKPTAESTMVVEESLPLVADDTTDNLPAITTAELKRPASLEESPTATMQVPIDAGLASLFDDSDLTVEMPDTTHAPEAAPPVGALDLDLTGALERSSERESVEDIGWLGDENDLTQTQKPALGGLGGVDQSLPTDLNSLANSDTNDEKLSDTLRDALALLERDYEDQFSASQMVDIKSGAPASTTEDDENTMVRTGTDRNRR